MLLLMSRLIICLVVSAYSCFSLAMSPERTLEGLVKDGLQGSVDIGTQLITLEQTELAATSAYTNLLPTLSLSAGRSTSTAESMTAGEIAKTTTTSNTAEVSGAWTLWDNYSNFRNITLANMTKATEVIRKQSTIENYILTLLDVYFEYLLTLRRKEVLEQQLSQSKWTHSESMALVKAGARTQLEALDTEIQVLNNERDLLEISQNLKVGQRNFQVLLNRGEKYEIPILNLLQLEPYFMKAFDKALPELKARSLAAVVSQTPDFRISKLSLDLSQERLKQTELGYWPTTSVKISHSYNLDNYVQEEPAGGRRAGLNSTTLSLNLSWQFFDWWGTQRSIKSSQLDFQSSQLRFRDSLQSSKAKFENLIENFEVTEKSLEASRLALLKAQKQQEFSREMYRVGRINLLSMQQSISRLYDAEISYASRKKAVFMLAAKLLYYHGTTLVPAL